MYVDLGNLVVLIVISSYVFLSRTLDIKDITEEYVHKNLDDHFRPNKEFETVQMDFTCCGEHGPIDYNNTPEQVPSSCCGREKGYCHIYSANSKGCYNLLLIHFKKRELIRAAMNFVGRLFWLAPSLFIHRGIYEHLRHHHQ